MKSFYRDHDRPKRLRQNSTSRPLSAINDLFDSRDFLFREKQDEVFTEHLFKKHHIFLKF